MSGLQTGSLRKRHYWAVDVTWSDVRRCQTGLPPEFARLPMRMVLAELARLTDVGLLHRV